MIRVLKDSWFNLFPRLFFCCTRPLNVNIDDEQVIQHTTSNTTYFSDDRLEGLTTEINNYRRSPLHCCGYNKSKKEIE